MGTKLFDYGKSFVLLEMQVRQVRVRVRMEGQNAWPSGGSYEERKQKGERHKNGGSRKENGNNKGKDARMEKKR